MFSFIDQLSNDPRYYFSVIITVIVSICLHELSHGIVAIWLGDRTPIETGHMTFNPLVHMGGMSLVMLAIAGISWGAMPVNPRRMRGRFAPALVAAAGPACNIVLAMIALVSLGLSLRAHLSSTSDFEHNTRSFLLIFGFTNVALAIFNLIPLPPLDGSRILADISPPFERLLERLARGGGLGIAFLVLFFFSGKYIFTAADHVSGYVIEHVITFHLSARA